MKSTVTFHADPDTLLRLISHLKARGGTHDLSEVINSAMVLWMREQSKLAMGNDPASVRGYQWKSLFLPEGTEIRSWSYGEHNYARVVGDEIIHNGRAVTPNQFAQSFARTTRNAWTDLFIRRPADQQFKMAHRLRQELAEQSKQPVAQDAPLSIPDTGVAALVAAFQAMLPQCSNAPPASAPPAPRDTTPGAGWTLPERRKFRFRLEDVAFD